MSERLVHRCLPCRGSFHGNRLRLACRCVWKQCYVQLRGCWQQRQQPVRSVRIRGPIVYDDEDAAEADARLLTDGILKG